MSSLDISMKNGMSPLVKVVSLTILAIFIIALFRGFLPSHPRQTAPLPPPITNPLPIPTQPLPSTEHGDNVPWIAYTPKTSTTDNRWGAILTDIEQHLNPKHGKTYYSSDNITHGHETTHGINSDIRMALGGTGKNGFYCLHNRAIVLTDPKCRISDVAPLIPQSLRGSRYNLYLVQQAHSWNDMPTYIFDEWVAYINGTEVGIDQVKHGLYNGRGSSSDDAIAPMEFTYYALALCQTVKQKDQEYFKQHPEFSEFIAFNIRRSVLAFREAIQMKEFNWETKLIDTFISNQESHELRAIAVELWGQAFVNKYLTTR